MPLRLLTRRHRGTEALLLGSLTIVGGCTTGLTDTTLETFAGEWCTYHGLSSSNTPARGVAFVGMILIVDGGQIFGTGTLSRAGDDDIIPSRYSGTVSGLNASIERSDLPDAISPGPTVNFVLTREGRLDLKGTMTGAADFSGPIHLVRLGPRCFAP